MAGISLHFASPVILGDCGRSGELYGAGVSGPTAATTRDLGQAALPGAPAAILMRLAPLVVIYPRNRQARCTLSDTLVSYENRAKRVLYHDVILVTDQAGCGLERKRFSPNAM